MFGALLVLLALPASAWMAEGSGAQIECAARPVPDWAPRPEAAGLEVATPGRWRVAWDPISGVAVSGLRGVVAPRVAVGEATAREAAEAFLRQNGALLGAGTVELQSVRWMHAGRAWHATWRQMQGPRPVVGCYLDLTLLESGEVVAFQSSLIPHLDAPAGKAGSDFALRVCENALSSSLRLARSEDVVAVAVEANRYVGRAAVEVELSGTWGGRWLATVDAGGVILSLESQLRTAAFEGRSMAKVLPLYAQDSEVTRPLGWLRLGLRSERESFDTVSSAQGNFFVENALPGAYRLVSGLDGLYLRVENQAGDPPPWFERGVAVPGSSVLLFEDGNSRLDERTIYYHAIRVHDYARETFGFTELDFPLPAVAAVRNPQTGDPNYANAFWNGEGIHFGTGAGVFYNLGLFADVIYHEYVHGITDYMYRPVRGLPGLEGGAIHEALSDYFACTLTGEPLLGENAFRDGIRSYLRNLENNLSWPEDRRFQVHGDGEILAGALWDLRRLLGPEKADRLVHFARTTFPKSFHAYADAVLLQDDLLYGDGAADNGSPNRSAILSAFAAHGIGPAASAGRRLVHDRLRDSEEVGIGRVVTAGFELDLSAPNDTLRLHVSNGGPFTAQMMHRDAHGRFHAEIPGVLMSEGAEIHYYITAAATRGRPELTHPAGAPSVFHVFHVGADLEPPVVQHFAITQAAYFSWPIDFTVRIDDNLGVGETYVEYFLQGESAGWGGFLRSADDPTRYMGRFPNLGRIGDRIGYRIVVVDASRAHNRVVLPETGVYELELIERLQETFENGSGGWMHGTLVVGRPDLWHIGPERNRTPGGGLAWFSGAAEGEYPANMASELVTDAYPIGAGARAHFWSWMDAEPNGPAQAFDGGIVQVRIEGEAEWQTIVPVGGYTHVVAPGGGGRFLRPGMPCLSGRQGGWGPLEFELGAFAGQRVRLRFLFESDPIASPFGLRGWALDDFEVDPGEKAVTDAGPEVAGRHMLRSSGPSPFRPHTSFVLEVPQRAGDLSLHIYDARGRIVRELLRGPVRAGTHRVVWDGRDGRGLASPSGVYYYRLRSKFGSESGSVVRLR